MKASARLLSFLCFLTLLPANAGAMFLPNALPQHSDRIGTTVTHPTLPHPGADVTRAAFVASIVAELFPPADRSCFTRLSRSHYQFLFRDVSTSDPHALELCTAMEAGIIQGYPDGNFRPNQVINAAEAAKVIAKSYGIGADPTDPHVPWYQPSVDALTQLGLPFPTGSLADSFTPDRAKFVLWIVRCSQYPAILQPQRPRSN